MCFKRKIEVEHKDQVIDKRLSHHAISYCWTVHDYILVLRNYGEFNVSKEDYEKTKIGDIYTWTTKERIK